MSDKPAVLFHGSSQKIAGALQPVLVGSPTEDRLHADPIVFATENAGVASLFMVPPEALSSIGFEQGIPYVCIWGALEEFQPKDKGGYLYVLPSASFEKRGKEYEWQSRVAVAPQEIRFFSSVLAGWKELRVRVYFITDNHLFDVIQTHKEKRLEILKDVRPYSGE